MYSSMVSPLPSTLREHVSQGNSLSGNVLEGLRKTVQLHVKKCHNCQVIKCRNHTYSILWTKLAITIPWEALCMDHLGLGPYTLKGKDKRVIDFMCITKINPATSWFEIAKLPVLQPSHLDISYKGAQGKKTNTSNKNNHTLTIHQHQSEH